MAKQGTPTVRGRSLSILIALGGTILAVAGCGGSDNAKTVTETITEEAASGASIAPDDAQPEPADGSAKSGGIEVAVTRAYTKPTVSYEGGTNYSPITPDAEPKTIQAPQGGRYVYVVSEVRNDTTEGIDPMCEYPMKIALRDTDHKRYDPVDGLFLVKGNPECTKLQPGFEEEITWVFLLPPGADVEALEFRAVNVTNFKESPPAAIALPSA